MKIKIRKIEVTPEEFFNALSVNISVHEKIPQNRYLGTGLEYICKNMGIKSLDFWKLKFDNEEYFNSRFVIKKIGADGNMFLIWRKEKYDSSPINKNIE